MLHIDLNADIGESFGAYQFGNDDAILQLVSSANVACGFHAGDPTVMLSTMAKAADYGARVGAHPSYRDLAGFGRRRMEYVAEDLTAEIIYQIGAAQAAAVAEGTEVSYVKPHGALYNRIATDQYQAAAVIEAILKVDSRLQLMALASSPLVHWARDAGLEVIEEVFADRAYNIDATLVDRSIDGAVHHDPHVIATQAVAFATGEPITTITGEPLVVNGASICVHGDNPEALANVRNIIRALAEHGIEVRA